MVEAPNAISIDMEKGPKSRLCGEPVVRGPGETARVTKNKQSGRWNMVFWKPSAENV